MNEYMYAAMNEALRGMRKGHGGPFGSVIVKDGEIIAKAHNKVLLKKDCTCHGEVEAIRKACEKLQTFDLSGCELYTTSEPCPMCKGAIQWARIQKVYYGCNIEDAASIGFDDKVFFKSDIPSEELDREDCQELFALYEKTKHSMY